MLLEAVRVFARPTIAPGFWGAIRPPASTPQCSLSDRVGDTKTDTSRSAHAGAWRGHRKSRPFFWTLGAATSQGPRLDSSGAGAAGRLCRRDDPQGRNRPASSFAPDGSEAR